MILPLAVSGVSPPDDDTEDTLFSPNAVDTERVELPVECLELSKRQKAPVWEGFFAGSGSSAAMQGPGLHTFYNCLRLFCGSAIAPVVLWSMNPWF